MSGHPWYIRPEDDDRDPWHAEGDAIAGGRCERDYDVAEAAELPDELEAYAILADADDDFAETFDDWLTWLHEGDDLCLVLAIEQCCAEGVLLPWDMRAIRLQTLPRDVLTLLHWFFDACPRHVLVHLVNYVFWLVRSERARRRGTPLWSPSSPKPPPNEWDVPPAFKPMKSWPRRWP